MPMWLQSHVGQHSGCLLLCVAICVCGLGRFSNFLFGTSNPKRPSVPENRASFLCPFGNPHRRAARWLGEGYQGVLGDAALRLPEPAKRSRRSGLVDLPPQPMNPFYTLSRLAQALFTQVDKFFLFYVCFVASTASQGGGSLFVRHTIAALLALSGERVEDMAIMGLIRVSFLLS